LTICTAEENPSTEIPMKNSLAVALAILGAVLAMTPAFSDHFYRQRFQAFISHPDANGATIYSAFSARMDSHHQLVYWSAGAVMIGAALLVRRRKTA
jgi:hypothetical protein